jgi:hypothetical protein
VVQASLPVARHTPTGASANLRIKLTDYHLPPIAVKSPGIVPISIAVKIPHIVAVAVEPAGVITITELQRNPLMLAVPRVVVLPLIEGAVMWIVRLIPAIVVADQPAPKQGLARPAPLLRGRIPVRSSFHRIESSSFTFLSPKVRAKLEMRLRRHSPAQLRLNPGYPLLNQ